MPSHDVSVHKQNLRAWRTPRDDFCSLDWNIYFHRGVIIQMMPMKRCQGSNYTKAMEAIALVPLPMALVP